MRTPRLKAPADWDRACYHCISRVVERRFAFGDEEHAEFVRLMRLYEKLCQVRVLTYCLMSNHFHLLVEVPARPAEPMPDEDLYQLIRSCFGKKHADHVRWEVEQYRNLHDELGAQRILESWFSRMWDISAFMKLLKQRFTQWFNHHHHRVGTLWESRFKSCLIEDGSALLMVATYIDLNPVRAKMVNDPKDYRWSGYAAAMGGVKLALCGLLRTVELATSTRVIKSEALARYRRFLYVAGESSPNCQRAGFAVTQVNKVLAKHGQLSPAQVLRCRIRYFIDGKAIGSKSFVNRVFDAYRHHLSDKRSTGARPMKGADFGNLCTLRNLRVGVIG